MEEAETQTKKDLAIQYIFSSLMIISIMFLIIATAIVFNPEQILNAQVRFGTTLGFIAFIFIMASMLMSNLRNLCDAIEKLNVGDYK